MNTRLREYQAILPYIGEEYGAEEQRLNMILL